MKRLSAECIPWAHRAFLSIARVFGENSTEVRRANDALWNADWVALKTLYNRALEQDRKQHQEAHHG